MKTMEQAWEDNFPFLQKKGLEAPYLLALCHARTIRHLEQILREWLPPNWRLSNKEFIEIRIHWEKYYKQVNRTAGSRASDHLARSALNRMTRYQCSGLEVHYLETIRRSHPEWNFESWKERMLVRPCQEYEYCGMALPNCFTIRIGGKRETAQLNVLWSDNGNHAWVMSFNLGFAPELSEKRTHLLCGLQKVLGHTRKSPHGNNLTLHLALEGSVLDVRSEVKKVSMPLCDKPIRAIVRKPGFYDEVGRQLDAIGLTIVYAPGKDGAEEAEEM